MTTINDGGPAFPFQDGYGRVSGMTLRQYYAGQVLTGLMANTNSTAFPSDAIATWCFRMANAMLKAEQEVKP